MSTQTNQPAAGTARQTPEPEALAACIDALRRAARADGSPRDLLFEAVADMDSKPDSQTDWPAQLYQSLLDIESWQSANPDMAALVDQAVRMLAATCVSMAEGRIDVAAVGAVIKALNHDAALERAARDGELRGRNAAIREHLDAALGHNGQPDLSGGCAAPRPRRTPSIFDLAAQA